MAFLEVRGIKKSFGKTEVLKGIDFDLNQGEVLSIIGSSGSGKTTLLRCLNYLETADAGEVWLNGGKIFDAETIKKTSNAEIRSRRLNWGMVFQQFNLFPQYTALKNVMLAPEESIGRVLRSKRKELYTRYKDLNIFKRIKQVEKEISDIKVNMEQEIESNARELLTRVGLEDKMQNYPCELSGGQCQRVAIARALAMRPNILCFDEPTSALDPELTGEVLKVIKELKYTTNSTMIIVTHEMEFAREVSDKVIFMSNGVVEEMGTSDEVFGNTQSEKLKMFLRKSKEKDKDIEDIKDIVEDIKDE